MKKFILAILFISIGAYAFAKQHKHSSKKPLGSEIVSVTLRHTPCYGRCPDYSIEVNKDGNATYTGIRFAHDSGVYSKKIGKPRAMRIINKFTVYQVDTCKDTYKKRVPDLPGMMLTIKYNDKIKTIGNVDFAPLGLRGINASIDSLTTDHLDNTWHIVGSSGKAK